MAAFPKEETSAAVGKILNSVSDIAAMPQVVYKIIELTGTTATAAQEIDRAISIDPGFSSKVLMLANSAFYALPRKVTSIREAATFIGFKAIRRLAMTIGCFDMFVGKSDSGSLRRRAWWRHSVDSAHCARAIATFVGDVDPDDAYACSLLHDVGKSFMDRQSGGGYAQVEALVAGGMEALNAEREVFGCSHADVAAAAASRWGFPDVLVEAVGQHHGPATGENSSHVALTAVASDIAHAMVEARKSEEGQVSGANFSPGIEWALEILNWDNDTREKVMAKGKAAISEGAGLGL